MEIRLARDDGYRYVNTVGCALHLWNVYCTRWFSRYLSNFASAAATCQRKLPTPVLLRYDTTTTVVHPPMYAAAAAPWSYKTAASDCRAPSCHFE